MKCGVPPGSICQICVNGTLDIKSGIADHFLQVNQDKTFLVLVIGPESQRNNFFLKYQTLNLHVMCKEPVIF